MKKYKIPIFYIATIGLFILLIFLMLKLGKANLENPSELIPIVAEVDASSWSIFLQNLMNNIATPTIILIAQLIVILIAVKFFGWLCNLIGQASVIGEIIAGVILGPSLLGYYFPEVSAAIFPESSLDNIGLLSQIGLILFMFIIGMELDLRTIRNRAEEAVVISHASIVFPFALGIILSYFIYEEFTHAHVSFLSFSLFMGIAMSITAFPVLARIIHERGINKKPIGPLVITCAAIDDVTAWCLLATVIAIVKAGSFTSSLFVILMAVVYILIMFKVVRPILKRIVDSQQSRRDITKSTAALFFIILFISAYITELIGIHALFGAFLAGVMMPTDIKFRNLLIEKIEYVSLIILLPLFFVYTGLRTQIGLLNTTHLWMICGLITLVAITGKFMGSALASRFVGISWKNSLTIGVLMNTRGLMELVVLNIGLDLKILSAEIFAMMVIMALVTTFMTSPSLDLIDRLFRKDDRVEPLHEKKMRVLIPFASSESGKRLLRIANFFFGSKKTSFNLTMLHVTEGNFLHHYNSEDEEKVLFNPILEKAEDLGQEINTLFDVSDHSEKSIVKIAKKGEYDFVLIGSRGNFQQEKTVIGRVLGRYRRMNRGFRKALSVWGGSGKDQVPISPFEDRTRYILSKLDTSIGIFIDRGFQDIQRVFVPILDANDVFVGEFLQKCLEMENVRLTLWDQVNLMAGSFDFLKSINGLREANPGMFHLLSMDKASFDKNVFHQSDLIVLSLRSWKKLKQESELLVESMPSTLILSTP